MLIAGNNDEFNSNETFNTSARVKKSYRMAFTPKDQADNCQSMSKDLDKETTVGEKGSGIYSYTSVKYTAADGTSEMVVCQGQKNFSFRTILEQEEEEEGDKTLTSNSNILTSGNGEDFTMSGDISLEVEVDKFQASTFILFTGDMKINQSNGQATGNMNYNGDFYFLQDKYRCNFEFSVDMSGQSNAFSSMDCDLTHNGEKVGSLSGDKVLDIDGNTVK